MTKQTKGIDGGDEISFSNGMTNGTNDSSSDMPTLQEDNNTNKNDDGDNNVFADKLDDEPPNAKLNSNEDDFMLDSSGGENGKAPTQVNDLYMDVTEEESAKSADAEMSDAKDEEKEEEEVVTAQLDEMLMYESSADRRQEEDDENRATNTPYPEVNTPYAARSASPTNKDLAASSRLE